MENQSNERRYCPNCYYPIEQGAYFCGHCGQKYTTGKVRIGTLLKDLIESVLNIDSKIFRTIRTLFIPGKLTVEYFKGRHHSYILPLRIFFFMAVVHFAVIGITQVENLKLNVINNVMGDPQKMAYHDVFLDELDSAKLITRERFSNNLLINSALDTLSKHMRDTRGDSIPFGYLSFQKNIKGKEIKIAKRDLVDISQDSLFKKYKIEGLLDQLQVRQVIKLTIEGQNFSQFVLSKLIWMIILMMPALALILKILYIRRNRYFVEHLVFSFHYHTFAFFVVSIGFVIASIMGNKDYTPVGVSYLLLLPYLFLAMQRVYNQGWFKTFIKYTILNFSYLLIFIVFFVLAILFSFLTYT